MKHLMLSTSLIVATAVPAFAGTETEASGSAEAEVQLETPAADASGEANVSGEAQADTDTMEQEAEELANEAEAEAEELANEAEAGAAELADEAEAGAAEVEQEASELATETENAAESMSDAVNPDADGPAMEALAEGEMTTEALTGAWTYDSNDEHIGEVSQVIVNTSGSVEAVIIDVGGFLGIGEKPVELTMGDLDIGKMDGDIRVKTHLTREELEALPEYQSE
ncbi:PRC-barrel domain-containing protein [Leisingera caerulea]|uniref:PRC-barrel domain-containing protein n=1 Tax=Leisingera caerulea TaxID=506591 RepID=A0A9Q9LWA3_LEICA|nr:PRC-barrel domain-containing protein [Leisingera caerulea]UWQ53420.1 PRC-barrel domain-containing protein [Leisingera caerulea]UWQ57999.1 PRC-barrel domain-containing protein [Leisingera caerulea]UWQ83027.1 PRC-barrel domain-containing protein [Leisingera caerulea]